MGGCADSLSIALQAAFPFLASAQSSAALYTARIAIRANHARSCIAGACMSGYPLGCRSDIRKLAGAHVAARILY